MTWFSLPRAVLVGGLLGALVGTVAVLHFDLPRSGGRATNPWHTDIVATTFWVGEQFDPTAPDGSQRISAFDPHWLANYGGCDGRVVHGVCTPDVRVQENGYFPRYMKPLQNPFYLDLPFDDINDDEAFAMRGSVIPWAKDEPYASYVDNRSVSFMKDRWVMIRNDGHTCYGQIQDAGPGEYSDVDYVFGTEDQRPLNKRYGMAGMDVSPALNGCLGFTELNGNQDTVDWRFIDAEDVPPGPWRELITHTVWG